MRSTNFEAFVKIAAEGGLSGVLRTTKALWGKMPGWGKALTVGIPAVAAIEYFARPFGIAGVFGGEKTPQAQTAAYRINRALHSLADRIRLDEIAAEAFTKTLASSTANEVLGLTKDTLSKAYENTKALFTSPTRRALFEQIRKETPELQNVPIAKLQEAYHTMAKFAPSLAEDKNAVKSFLTQAAVSGSGIDFGAIRGIAEAERAIQQAKNPK